MHNRPYEFLLVNGSEVVASSASVFVRHSRAGGNGGRGLLSQRRPSLQRTQTQGQRDFEGRDCEGQPSE